MEAECHFAWKFRCIDSKKKEALVNVKAKRIENIIRCSKIYKDEIHQKLQLQYDSDKDLTLKAHSSCVNKYVHPKEVKKALKRNQSDEEQPDAAPRKRARRSEHLRFNFLQHCIFCGENCEVKRDPKHPSRWKPAYICRQVGRQEKTMSLKEEILAKCDERDDYLAAQVQVRVSGAISDLHAADARYHVACRTNFMSSRSTSAASKEAQAGKVELDKGLQDVISIMEADMSHMWNSVDL